MFLGIVYFSLHITGYLVKKLDLQSDWNLLLFTVECKSLLNLLKDEVNDEDQKTRKRTGKKRRI